MSDFQLMNGDAFELLGGVTDNSVNLVLTDPPYNISQKNNIKTMKDRNRQGLDFGDWDKDFDLTGWIDIVADKVTKNGAMIVFSSWKHLSEISLALAENGFDTKDIIRYVKPNPMPRNRDRRYVVDCEYAIWAVRHNGKWTFNRQDPKYQSPEFRFVPPTGKNRIHPTEKPVKLMQSLVEIHSNPNDIILDPFMGSGSAGVAALNLNRKFIGIEMDKHYFDLAKERIERVDSNC